jgi:hypothetical protein
MTLLLVAQQRAPALVDSIDHSMSILVEARSLRIADADANNMNVVVAVAEQHSTRLDQFLRGHNSSRQQRPLHHMVQSLKSGVVSNHRYIVENDFAEAIPHTTTPVTMRTSNVTTDAGIVAEPLPSGSKTRRVRFGPTQTLYIGRCHVKKQSLWWSKGELERLRNQSRTMRTNEERQSLTEYLHAVEVECVRILDPNETSPESATSDSQQQMVLRGLACGHQGLERFAPLELRRQEHRRSTVRDIVALSRSWTRNPYRSDLIRTAYVQKAGPAVEWALSMGTAAYLATTATTTTTVEPPEEPPIAVVANWMHETRDYQRIEV